MTAFWLTYKPLTPGSPKGWPPEKMTELARRFERDPDEPTEWWRLSAHRMARPGDRVFLFRQGDGYRGIFGVGEIIEGPTERTDESGGDGEKWRVRIRFNTLVDPARQVLMSVDEVRGLGRTESLINAVSNGQSIPQDVAEELERRLVSPAAAWLASDAADDGAALSADLDERERALRAIVLRRGRTAFRAALMSAYEGRCALTACAIPELLEAAHIRPYRGPATDAVNNGLLLRTDIHTLLDCGLLAFEPTTGAAVLARSLDGSSYAKLAGRKLRAPREAREGPNKAALTAHFQAFTANR